jgi:AAA15 family ATPase/GTPase
MRELLEAADVGIADFRVEGAPTARGKKGEPKRVVMYHEVGGDDEARLDLERESAGTRAIFNLGPALIDVLRRGGVLVVDELEASLHPLLAMEVVKQFNDPRSNPQNAQLVFTTHDTALLGILVKPAPLRRDQVWLTEKDPHGATRLYPLTDYKALKAENIERGYVQGRYGAIPFLGALTTWEK